VTSIEGAILMWLAIGAGIAAGVFVIARAAVQIASVAYRVIEKQIDTRTAARQTTLLSAAIVVGLVVTAVVAGYAILVIFGTLLENGTS
jgi:predicted ABC-type ATPase